MTINPIVTRCHLILDYKSEACFFLFFLVTFQHACINVSMVFRAQGSVFLHISSVSHTCVYRGIEPDTVLCKEVARRMSVSLVSASVV